MINDSIVLNSICIPKRDITYISPNNMAISALSLVWIWLRPELPEQLIYTQSSVFSYIYYTLIKSLRYKQKNYENYYYKCIESINACEYQIRYAKHTYINYRYPRQLNDFNKFIDDNNNILNNYKKQLPIKKDDYDMLKIKVDYIVNTLTPLQACCYGMYELLMI